MLFPLPRFMTWYGDYQAFLKKPWRAIWQRQLGGKDGEAFGTTIYSAAPGSASKREEINVPVPFFVRPARCPKGMFTILTER